MSPIPNPSLNPKLTSIVIDRESYNYMYMYMFDAFVLWSLPIDSTDIVNVPLLDILENVHYRCIT